MFLGEHLNNSSIMPFREYINQEDLTKAARKVGEAKKHESKLQSDLPVF